jgi:hypothetical protein
MDEPVVDTLDTTVDNLETPVDTLETLDDTTEAPAPKKKGRPVGARSKVQGKPRPKRVAANRMRARALEEETAPLPPAEEAELPRALAGSRPIPQESEVDPRDRTSMLMMSLLREQAAERRQRKTDLWKSWFQ